MIAEEKLLKIIEVLTFGGANLQANNPAPWECTSEVEYGDEEDWEIYDSQGSHVVTIDHNPEDNENCAREICESVNLADEVMCALARQGGGTELTPEKLEAAYRLIVEREEKADGGEEEAVREDDAQHRVPGGGSG